MEDKKSAPVVISGYRKNDDLKPVFITKDMEDESDAVVLKFDKNDNVSKGFYVDVPKGALTTVALANMASEIGKFYKTRGNEISPLDLKLLVSALTSRIVYVPVDEIPLFVSRLSSYFCNNVFYIDRLNDADYLKGCFSACRDPERVHFFVVNLKKDRSLPNFLVSYLETPASRIVVKMEEYVNDIFIGNIRLTDNIFVIATGDISALPHRLRRLYSVWDPKVSDCEKEETEYKTISMGSFKNMHKVMNPVDTAVWDQVEKIEDMLHNRGIVLSNKDCNQLDDYLVTLINQDVSVDVALSAFVKYRLAPMLKDSISEEELKTELTKLGIYLTKEEN